MRPSVLGGSGTFALLMIYTGCQGSGAMQPINTVNNLDLQRFMGTWYVLADIATPFDKDAYAPMEYYSLTDSGRVETVYRYRKGGPEGELKSKTMSARPNATMPSVWGMRVFWPFEADYRVAYLDSDYQHTVVARNKRDFVWIMARDPKPNLETTRYLLREVEQLGYDLTKLRFHHGLEGFSTEQGASLNPEDVPAETTSQTADLDQSTPRFGT